MSNEPTTEMLDRVCPDWKRRFVGLDHEKELTGPVAEMLKRKLAHEAKLAEPLPEIAPCHYCHSARFHRHASNPTVIVVSHEPDCACNRGLSHFREGSEAQTFWNSRKEPPAEKPVEVTANAKR